MSSTATIPREAIFVAPGQGRRYSMGSMRAVFKADGAETQLGYSISEWWLEPNTRGPGPHAHSDEHVFYVIEGTLSVQIAHQWMQAAKGSYLVIPGGTQHDFENRERTRCGFIAFNVPGGFEDDLPAIAEYLTENPVGKVNPE